MTNKKIQQETILQLRIIANNLKVKINQTDNLKYQIDRETGHTKKVISLLKKDTANFKKEINKLFDEKKELIANYPDERSLPKHNQKRYDFIYERIDIFKERIEDIDEEINNLNLEITDSKCMKENLKTRADKMTIKMNNLIKRIKTENVCSLGYFLDNHQDILNK